MRRLKALLLCLLSTAICQAQQPAVSYVCEALQLRQVLPDISKQAKAKLLVSDELANEPVVLRLNSVPLEEFKTQLAKVFLAEWVTTDQGLELRRTPKVVAPFLKARQDAWVKSFEESMQQYRDVLKGSLLTKEEADRIAGAYVNMLVDERTGRGGTSGIQMRAKLSNRTADMRLRAQMLLAIGPDRLANLPNGRTVFAPNPTSMQQGVDEITPAMLDEYVAQHNLLAAAIQAKMPNDGEIFDGYGNSAMASASNMAVGPVRPLLIITIDRERGRAWSNFSVYNSKGEHITGLPLPIGPTKNLDQQATERAQAAGIAAKQPEIKLSPVAQELSRRWVQSSDSATPLSPEAVDLLLHPEMRDPMNSGFSEVANKISEMEDRNLIATLQDDNIRPVTPRTGGVKAASFELSMTFFGQARFDREDGWLLIHPTNPLYASRTRMDRAPIGQFLSAYNEQGFSTIEDWAQLAALGPADDDLMLANTLWNLLRGESSTTGSNETPILRAYGLLSPEQVRALTNGQTLSYHTLPQEQQEAFASLLYGGTSSSSLRRSNPEVRGGTPPMLLNIEAEATESVPDGIPANTFLRMRETSNDQFYVAEGSGNYEMPRRTISFEELAMEIAGQAARPDPNWDISGIHYGRRRVITIELLLSETLELMSELQEDRVPKGPPMQIADLEAGLPPEVWEKLKKLIAAQKEQQKKIQSYPPPAAPSQPPR